MGKFRELRVWQRARDLAVYLYRITGEGKTFSHQEAERRMKRWLKIRWTEQVLDDAGGGELFNYLRTSPELTR